MTELYAEPATQDGRVWQVLVIRRSTARVAATVRSTIRAEAEREAAKVVRRGVG